uniref:NAD-dependent epimerase/dehydratase domain-containing protein n=1 Tax=Araucaria cunninghamii TaxID=56994 RepID=A0A0D6R743_ARACU
MGVGEAVCVTGASGFIGSWVVRLLLERGYAVHATVQNLENWKETKHLEEMEGAEERLKLFQIELMDYESIQAAINGCVGVFHLAMPNTIEAVSDPEKQLLDPGIKGTLNVLEAAHKAKVKRVVLTSSVSAIIPNPKWPKDTPLDENCWTDLDYCKQNGIWYTVAKTLAEKAAWEFSKEKGLDIVAINPGTALGPILPPDMNASMAMIIRLLSGHKEEYRNFFMGCAHVRDIAKAQILLYETPSASGRHLCVESIAHWSDFAELTAKLYPEYDVPKFTSVTQPGLVRVKNAPKKLIDLGMEFTSMEQIIKDCVSTLKAKGFLK